MASGQLKTQVVGNPRPTINKRVKSWIIQFLANRAREAGYGTVFASIFLLCQSPANALVIDDIRVLSKLGEPLAAQIVVTPAAGEIINRGCFSTRRNSGDLPDLGPVRLSLSRSLNISVLNITGSQAVREPLSEFVLQVKCPGVATLFKSFLVMVDPPTEYAASTATPALVAPPVTATNRSRSAARSVSRTTPARSAIEPGSRYTVAAGDTLSTIASRVANRPNWSVWPIAQQIYATNPGAFLLGDPNIIAEGSVVFVPRLADIDMSLASAPQRPAVATRTSTAAATPGSTTATSSNPITVPTTVESRLVAGDNATRAAPLNNAARALTAAIPKPVAAGGRVTGQNQIMPTPTGPAVATITEPLPAMQLTAQLLDESKIKVLLRAQGSPVPAAVVAQNTAVATPESAPDPRSAPERPDSIINDNRAAIQPDQATQVESKLNWLWILVGLFSGLLIGALAAVSVFRRNLRHEYEHDVLDAVQRQVQIDRMRQQELPSTSETPAQAASAVPATMDLDDSAEVPTVSDNTIEMSTAQDVDFELTTFDEEPAKTGAPETIIVPGVGEDLDLNLTAETGKTGQHEVDFDLLEAAYSDDYQNEFVSTAGTKDADAIDTDTETDTTDSDESGRYYHLENRDPTDESPLPFELGDDEMGDDDDEADSKVVRFRR